MFVANIIFDVEIICKPNCPKCSSIEEKTRAILTCMSLKERVSIHAEFKHNKNILEAEKHGYKILDLPIVLINGKVAFVGPFKNERLIRVKLEDILKNPF